MNLEWTPRNRRTCQRPYTFGLEGDLRRRYFGGPDWPTPPHWWAATGSTTYGIAATLLAIPYVVEVGLSYTGIDDRVPPGYLDVIVSHAVLPSPFMYAVMRPGGLTGAVREALRQSVAAGVQATFALREISVHRPL